MRQNSLIGGTVVLGLAAICNRIIGIAFRAYVVRAVGEEALGLYQMAFPLYTGIASVATAGISIGVAKIVTDHRQKGSMSGATSTLKAGCLLALITSFLSMLILFFGRHIIAVDLLKDERTLLPLLALIPALPIIAMAGALRGFCQGMRFMSLVALGLLIEQVAHTVFALAIIARLGSSPPETLAMGLALGYTGGELLGLISIGLSALLATRHHKAPAPGQMAPLIAMVLPVATGRIFLALSSTLNNVLLPRSLRFMGYSATEAAVLYGQLTGMALSVLFLPAVLTFPLASNLLPAMAESTHSTSPKQKQHRFQRGLSYALLLGMPSSVLFITVGPELCQLLFGVPAAGQLLALLGWVAWLIYLQHITTATLQGLGKPALPTRNAVISTLLSSLTIIILSRFYGSLGITAAVFAIMVGTSCGAVLGLVAVLKETGGTKATTSIILRGATAAAVSLFMTLYALDVLALAGLPRILLAGVVIALSFYPLALIFKLHRA
ncbi:MAG: oligosaccharide flippase family protein [Firmicutes bacterium]|nr:oligosaccharide flippase family protein [Dethiobacter sp.]MBS3887870.1 oligosaccharide flippase family protein [Bacillota bacterium]MBS4053719.1 oligosaccharide flippase family protein [Thermaerobacter sp.]